MNETDDGAFPLPSLAVLLGRGSAAIRVPKSPYVSVRSPLLPNDINEVIHNACFLAGEQQIAEAVSRRYPALGGLMSM